MFVSPSRQSKEQQHRKTIKTEAVHTYKCHGTCLDGAEFSFYYQSVFWSNVSLSPIFEVLGNPHI